MLKAGLLTDTGILKVEEFHNKGFHKLFGTKVSVVLCACEGVNLLISNPTLHLEVCH